MPAKERASEEREGDEIADKIQEPNHWRRISGNSSSYLDNPAIDIIGEPLESGVPSRLHYLRGFPKIQAVFKIGVFVACIDRRGGGANSEKDGESYEEKEYKYQLFVGSLYSHLISAAEQSAITHGGNWRTRRQDQVNRNGSDSS